ncbi:hexose transport-related protein [Cordyceps fumosorosea ARSEF 2679]|uniref:Hexose transport-related protein n=1 Tax=Cordyceps fumosorosea (strain ARSEF 2679) TaxID=1081104 RepID=A0A167WHE6_CORFA|nr:hexose transport-related protein [Cordyceps fumosorosea ARSEF 2679]OAA63793.1 hexose transport-related protein [Cordyceps fumosorosea ARSEF 2679]
MIGSLFTGPICDRFGRRAGMMTGSVLIMVGAAVQTAARSNAYLLGGRFVLGFGVSIVARPCRWLLQHLYVLKKPCRPFSPPPPPLATGVAYAAVKSPGEEAFRLPLGLQLLPPVFIFAGALVIPESPRWLTMWGRKEEAAAVLAKYHGGGDMQHPMVQLELREFEAGLELQRASSVWNYWGLVDSHNARWRFAMMACMSVFAQLSGNSVLTYYLPSMYKLLGVKTPERKLLLTFANTIVSGAGAVAGSALNDSVGRRTKLWMGSIVLAGLFGGVTGFSSYFEGGKTDVSATITNGGIAFIFLFGCAYSFIYTPLTATYCAEVLSTPMRAKGMGIHVILSNCANLYNTYVTAVALEAIDFRYYFVFVGLNLVYAAVWFFFGVETRGRTLEEMEEVFDAKFPPRAALQKAVMVKQRDGHLADVGAGAAGDGERV